jgi:cellulose synthase/poly-beta-1,6-N-acetylglucosamine synthase-like glycosyltransferase
MKFTDIQRTQQVEYHFAHLMDKPFEASFGFIHVLPGAFSAYNMDAILDYDNDDDELLKSYFKSIDEKLKNGRVSPSRLSIGSVLMRTMLPDFVTKCFIDIKDDS